MIKRMRTINETVKEIRAQDAKSCINEWAIRNAIKEGSLPYSKSASRYYVALEDVFERFGIEETAGNG